MYKFEFTAAQINVIASALEALPLGKAFDVYVAIKNQLDEQQNNNVKTISGD